MLMYFIDVGVVVLSSVGVIESYFCNILVLTVGIFPFRFFRFSFSSLSDMFNDVEFTSFFIYFNFTLIYVLILSCI